MEYQDLLEFIPAKELKQSFSAFGHFYSINLNGSKKTDFRSVLEIVTQKEKEIRFDIGSLIYQLPDAISILMNPGSSTPLKNVDNMIKEDEISQLDICLVPAEPDETQYQIMRVMYHCNWKHVRVINLSDMRDSKSEKFTHRYISLENQTGFTAHSLFTDTRDNELNFKLKRKKEAPIVCAWGVNPKLNKLINQCLGKIGNLPTVTVTGLLKRNTNNKYYHPLPRSKEDQKEWLKDMVMLLKKVQGVTDRTK